MPQSIRSESQNTSSAVDIQISWIRDNTNMKESIRKKKKPSQKALHYNIWTP
jgi:hypothetical protein